MPSEVSPERVDHLSLDEALEIHERVIKRFGGEGEIRDPGLLESALHRPRTGYYRDLASMATALFESLLINHPFVDGNKRVAFFATDVFLRLNGWKLAVDPDEAHAFMTTLLDEGRCDFVRLLPWIRESMTRLGS